MAIVVMVPGGFVGLLPPSSPTAIVVIPPGGFGLDPPSSPTAIVVIPPGFGFAGFVVFPGTS